MSKFQENIQKFLPYLEEIRSKLFASAIIFICVFIAGFFSSGIILKKFFSYFDVQSVTIATTSPFQLADLAMDIGLFLAILITLPIVFYHLSKFVYPALNKKEKKLFFIFIPTSVILFLVGFIYSFFILYYSFEVLARLNETFGIKNIWNINTVISQLFITASLFGLIFEFPLIMSIFIKLGIFDSNSLRKRRRIAIFSLVILVSLLPPTDGLSLLVMALPLVLLYEGTILLNNKQKTCLV